MRWFGYIRLVAGVLVWLALALGAAAQTRPQEASPPPLLVADDIKITRDRQLVARGNVEVFSGTTRLRAEAIVYDPDTETLNIEGPIVLEDGEGMTILANAAELERDLQNGLLRGARMVLEEQLQLAAVEMNRVGGRYTQLYRTAVTSCRICANDPQPPIWQIRARRIIHDQQERQLYFDDATLHVLDLPVLYLPRLRLPDPTLKRATGFLMPSIRSTSDLGTGIKVPYFIRLGDHRDLTLTPYLSSRTRTLQFRYRQAFVRGDVQFDGAVTRDDLRPDATRGYLFGTGIFEIENDYVLEFDIKTVTDDDYLDQYGFSDGDRLKSQLAVSKAERDRFVHFGFVNFRSLREGEDNDTIPTNIFDAVYQKRFFPSAIGGEVRLTAVAHSHVRTSGRDTDGPDPDFIPDGRDVARATIQADWLRRWRIGAAELRGRIGFAADAFRTREDAGFPDSDSGLAPHAALTLRYPLIRRGAKATQLLEPVAQIGWVGGSQLDVPNDESTRVEFDEGNLLELSRFPSPDRREYGAAAALGLGWTRLGEDDSRLHLSVGQVFRTSAEDEFTKTSGLDGTTSDMVVAGQFAFPSGTELSARAIFDGELDVAKAEVRGAWIGKRMDVTGIYTWLTDDAAEERPDPIAEINLNSGFVLSRHWRANVGWRYDLEDNRATRTLLGLTYENECVALSLGVNRRFTSSTSVEPTTNVGFTVMIKGFSVVNGSESYVRTCG